MAPVSHMFRVFVSSTFSDLTMERDALQRHVFPALRDHCAERGYSFQAIDLRWGIGEEASAGQRTMRICLDELARCQEVTPRPNFLILLGDRYGWRPLPEEVPREEFEEVRSRLEQIDPEATALADEWYRLDDNALPEKASLPGAYRLQPRDDTREAAWNEAQLVLGPALREAARSAGLETRDPDAFVKYTASATEQEILAGALAADVEAASVFAFCRTVEGWPEGAAAKPYRDLTRDGEVDAEAAGLLTDLKARLERRLGENLSTETVAYDDFAAHLKMLEEEERPSGPFSDYLDRLCARVRAALTAVIDAEIERLKDASPEPEKEAHELFREERASSFTGREEYLAAIAAYLAQSASHPLIVWGAGGCGKSALLAQAITEARAARDTTADPPGATLVHRFVGATPSSADIRSLLRDVYSEIGTACGLEGEAPSDFNELVRAFRERLEAAGAERPLLLFLDSLDQLAVSYGAHGLSWLPTELPEGVWLVASTRPDEDDEAPRDAGSDRPVAARGQPATLQRLLPESAIIELGPMTLGEAEELLTKWLSGVRRELTGVQRSTVIDSFARYDPSGHRGLPLHLRLAFETARTWCSYNEPTGIRDRVREMVAALYERLEREHGPVLVGHTLAYLAATRNTMGLAEDEILDLFSAESDTESEARQGDAVLREFNERTKPEHRPPDGSLPPRLPVVVWSRLFFDLQPYLSTRSSEGASLLAFYHRELGEVATKRYLDGHRQDRHTVLAAMFRSMGDPRGDGTWAGRPRALAELPYHLTGAKRWDDAFEVLTDFTFLEEKAQRVGVVERPGSDEGTLYTGVYALLDDYETALAEFPSE